MKRSSSPTKLTKSASTIINSSSAAEDEEWWFRGVAFWLLILCVLLDIGASSSELWKVFQQFFIIFYSNKDRSKSSKQNNHYYASCSDTQKSANCFDEEYSNNFTQGVHVFALITHLLVPVSIYFIARAKYGAKFLAWQPFEGGRSFISAEFIAFTLWVGGLVVRWTQLFVVSGNSSSDGNSSLQQINQEDNSLSTVYSIKNFVPSPVYVQESTLQIFQMLSTFLPQAVIKNAEVLSDDPTIYPYIAFLVSPRVLWVLRTSLIDFAGRALHTLGSAIFFYLCIGSFSPSLKKSDDQKEQQENEEVTKKINVNNNDDANPNIYTGTLASWILSSGRVLSDTRKSISTLWHHAAVRGTIVSALLLAAVVLYFLIVGTFYVSSSPDPATQHKYVFFFFWKIPLPVLSKVIMVMHIVCALAAHFIFGLTNLVEFKIFKPFVGPKRYIIFQMVAWTCFGVAVVLYRALVPSLETRDRIPREPWIAANVLSLTATALLLISNCSRHLFWNKPELFQQSVKPSDIARVSVLFAFALLIFYALFFFLTPMFNAEMDVERQKEDVTLIENVMRQLAICAVCISPVTQGIVLFCIPVYYSYIKNNNTFTNNRNSSNTFPATTSSSSPEEDSLSASSNQNNNVQTTGQKTMLKFIKKCFWLFIAAEVWVASLIALYVLPNNNESSAIVICLALIAQGLYFNLLKTTNGTAATIVRQHREVALLQQENNNYESKQKSTGTANTEEHDNNSALSFIAPSPKARKALSAFIDIDNKIIVNGPLLLSFSLFSHSLIFRWILCVISAMHLFAPVRLNQLTTLSIYDMIFSSSSSSSPILSKPSDYFHNNHQVVKSDSTNNNMIAILNPQSWSTLGSFGLACAFFCFALSVPIAHFSIRGLRGLVVNPFTGTPSFAATQVSSWISHIVSFAFLLHLLVNDLLSYSSAWETISGKEEAYQENNRIVFGDYSAFHQGAKKKLTRSMIHSHLFRIFITVVGNTMLETGAMFLPYVLSFASILTFDSLLRKKTNEVKTEKCLIDAVSSLSASERKSLEDLSSTTKKNKSNSNLSHLVSLLLTAADDLKNKESTSPKTTSTERTLREQLFLDDDDLGFFGGSSRRMKKKHRRRDDDINKKLYDDDDENDSDIESDGDTDEDNNNANYSSADGILATVHPAVLVLIIFCLSCTSFLLVLIGEKMLQSEVLAHSGNVPDAAIVFIPAVLGLLSCSFGIIIAHAWLGPALFDESSYVLWMPFKGGFWFILIQISGFSAYTASFVQTVFCFAALMSRATNTAPNLNAASSMPVSLIPVAALSGIAPLLIAFSALFFVPSSSSRKQRNQKTDDLLSSQRRQLSQTFVKGSTAFDATKLDHGDDDHEEDASTSSGLLSIEDNAEGIICLLVLFGGWVVAAFTDQLTPSGWASATAPLIIVSILLSIAAPLGVVSLRKSARQWSSATMNRRNSRRSCGSDDEDAENLDATTSSSASDDIFDVEGLTPEKKRRGKSTQRSDQVIDANQATSSHGGGSSLLAPPLIIVESLIVSLLCVLPIAVLYAFYKLASSASSSGFEIWYTLQDSYKWIFALLSLGILMTLYARGFFGIFVAYASTYFMFMMPNIPYIVAVMLPLMRPNSISAIWVPIEFCLSVPLPVAFIQPILFLFDSVFLSIASRRLICLTICHFFADRNYCSPHGGFFCSSLKLPKGVEANYLFGSNFPQALEHTFVFLLCLLYKFSFIGSPAVRGTHRSPLMEYFFRKTVIYNMEKFFSLKIFAEKSYVLEVNNKITEMKNNNTNNNDTQNRNKEDERLNFIFGFHPHGILAFTCSWLPLSTVWRSMNLPRRVSRFGASIIFNVPLLRDAAMSLGAKVVTKESIHYTLDQNDGTVSAMLVPGGQAEMLESRASKTEIFVKNHHKGFLRIALKKNKPAVPVFCFGEHEFLENVQMPKVQRFFLRLIGFGLPVVPMGALGFLPLPLRVPLTVVVGNPIDPKEILAKAKKNPKLLKDKNSSSDQQQQQTKNNKSNKKSNTTKKDRNAATPSQHQTVDDSDCYFGYSESEIVDMFAEEYFGELKRIFYKYREEAGYPELELKFTGKNY